MFKFRAKVAPDRHAMARPPPRGQNHIHQKENTQNGSRPHPKPDQKRDPNQQFDNPNYVPEENRMRKNYLRQYWTIKTDHTIRNVVLQISLKSSVSEPRSGHLVFAEEQEKYRGCNPHTSDCPGQGGGGGHQLKRIEADRRFDESMSLGGARRSAVPLAARHFWALAPAGILRRRPTPLVRHWKHIAPGNPA